jgi:small subunit ribosomal protein S9
MVVVMARSRKKEKSKDSGILMVGKRKSAVARASIASGSGKVRINSLPLDIWGNDFLRMRIKEPLIIAGDVAKGVDISVKVNSGGTSGQTDAVRMAIAKALLAYAKNEQLRKKFIEYDRNLLVFDPRRNEPHKPSRSRAGPRRHKQRSKR